MAKGKTEQPNEWVIGKGKTKQPNELVKQQR